VQAVEEEIQKLGLALKTEDDLFERLGPAAVAEDCGGGRFSLKVPPPQRNAALQQGDLLAFRPDHPGAAYGEVRLLKGQRKNWVDVWVHFWRVLDSREARNGSKKRTASAASDAEPSVISPEQQPRPDGAPARDQKRARHDERSGCAVVRRFSGAHA
jgi:hypothetical protein